LKALRYLGLLSLLFPLITLGCHKKQPATAADTAQNPETASASTLSGQSQAPVDPAKALPPPSPTVAANADNSVQANVSGQADPFLTSQLQIFISKNGRMPNSFTEFARQRLDSMPVPPAGTKWAIDTAVSQVKAVPK